MNKTTRNWLIFFATVLVAFFVGWLGSNITEKNTEARFVGGPKAEIGDMDSRNEVWGKNYPKQFESYYETADTTFASKYNGSHTIDELEEDPMLVMLWAGYGFSKGYKQGRGHFYAVEDLREIERTGAPTGDHDGPMPGTCWTCKSPDVPRYMKAKGAPDSLYAGKWASKGAEIVNPIGCADCHDPKTMDLTITRPALIEAFEEMGKDINKATHNEMRSLVCAQCHVEYYFDKKKPGHEGVPYLTFPWKYGMGVDEMEKYYDEIEFADWTHKISGTPMLKAQHPGYETFVTGVHAKRGVSCADCHMPYKTEGGVKFTDHKIQSPLNNIENSCGVCHREKTQQLVDDVYQRQDAVKKNTLALEKILVRAHVETAKAMELGATDEQLKDIRQDIRHGQWRWDYSVAAHGASFHAPVETARIVSTGIEQAQDARVKLARLLSKLGFEGEVPYPDVDTKEKAQRYIGLDPEKMKSEKERFLKTLVPQWDAEAEKREATYGTKEGEKYGVGAIQTSAK